MFARIRKRDGREVPFNAEKIAGAIGRALAAVGEPGTEAMPLTERVVAHMEQKLQGSLDRKSVV